MSLDRPSRSRLLALVSVAILLAGVAPVALAGPVAAAVLAPPTLTAPDSGSTVTGNPVFRWTAVSGAARYRIEVSATPTFASTLVADETQNLQYTPIAELPLGTLYWHVAARDASNTLGTYAGDSFTKDWGVAPNPLAPAGDATLTFPTDPLLFTWDALAGAQSYELQVDDADDFIGATTYTTKNTSYVVTEPKTNGQSFYWHVRGVSGGIYSDWSVGRRFDVQWPSVPTLTYPAPDATLTDVYVDWSPVLGAKTYELQISPNGDWANNVIVDVTVKGTRYAPPTTLNNANYFWRVRAKDAAATPNNGGWSEERRFQRNWLDRPTLLAPANGDYSADVPTFSWAPVAHAAYYELQYSQDPNFLSSISCTTNHTTVTPYSGTGGPGSCTIDPIPGMTYYWHVRGIDPPVLNPGAGEPGVLGLWSNASNADVWSFVHRPDNPVPVGPASASTVQVPTLDWSDSSGAAKYQVTVVKANGSVATTATTYSTSYTPTTALNPADGPFRWYVQSYNFNNRVNVIPAQSTWWSFNLVPITPTYALPEPTAPPAMASSVEMPALAWQPVTGADHYRVWYSPNSGVYFQLASNLAYPAYTYPTSVFSVGPYQWFAEAFDKSGAEISSSSTAGSFVITEPDLVRKIDYAMPQRCPPGGSCSPIADTPTLRWNPVPGALSYMVYVAQDPNFTNMYRTYTTTFTELTPRDSYLDNQAGQAYYWFVRPIRSNNTGRFDSEAQQNASAFQKRSEGIHRTTPLQDAHVANEITFDWHDFLEVNQGLTPAVTQEAKQYRIQVSTVADFASTIDTQVVDQPFYTPFDRTYPEGPIYWRVQAIDGSNNPLTYSSAGLAQKDSPAVVLSHPANAANVLGVPYLQWNPQAYAAQYDVQLDNDDNFSSPITTVTTKMTAWAYTDPLAAGTYYWRVRREDADNRPGPWSSGRSFNLAPAAPTLTSPTNGAKPSPATLIYQWTASQPAPKYTIEVSTTNTFGMLVGGTPKTTVMTQWAPLATLANGTYYWRVKAINANGGILATSGTWSFTINLDTTRPTVTSISPTSSATITTPFTATFSEAVGGVSDSTFVVKVAGASSALAGTVTVLSATSARFTPAARLVPGQTYTVSLTSGITDLVGNQLVAYGTNVRAATTVQQDSSSVRETWARWTTASASGGAMKLARTTSAQLTFKFSGSDVALVGFRGPSGGYATVTLDGVIKTSTLSFYSASNLYKQTLWSTAGLAPGNHTVQVAPRGTKPTGARDTWVYVDAFVVGGSTFQDESTAVTERFRGVTSSSASGSSYDLMSHVAASGVATPSLTFQFAGTGLTWYGTKGSSYGKATVYVDNVSKGTVDLYRSATAYKQSIWTSAALSNGVHTIKIVVAGTKRSAAKGYDVSFDYFAIK